MDIVEYRGFKNIFIGLACENNKYYLLCGKTGQAIVTTKTDTCESRNGWNALLTHFVYNQDTIIDIPFVSDGRTYVNLFSISGEEEYHRLVKILENLL